MFPGGILLQHGMKNLLGKGQFPYGTYENNLFLTCFAKQV